MEAALVESAVAERVCPETGAPDPTSAHVRHVSLDQLETRLAPLRVGRARRQDDLAELPLRVVPLASGRFEVADGFKRLERWRAEGAREVPVVVESARSRAQTRVLLLRANAPQRTLSPMDEARVVHALRTEEKLGPRGIATLCGRRTSWVTSRLALAGSLEPGVVARVDAGAVGVSLAHALCGVARSSQEPLVLAAERHRLTGREALALVSAYRASSTDGERRSLLEAPLQVVRPTRGATQGSLAARLEERLARARAALEDLLRFALPEDGLSPSERRRLAAAHRSLLHQLHETARALTVERDRAGSPPEEIRHGRRGSEEARPEPELGAGVEARAEATASKGAHADRGRALEDPRARGPEARDARDRTPDRARPEARPLGARGGGEAGAGRAAGAGEQARSLPAGDRGEGREGPHQREDPPRDPGAGLHRWPDDPPRARPLDPRPACPEEARPLPLRDASG